MTEPYYETKETRIYNTDAVSGLRILETDSVNCIVTSPPYWNLRDYGVDGQLGQEKTPEEFCDNLVAVFHETKRVLRDDGTLWVNLGDTYLYKQLLGIPWMFVFAMKRSGWILRSDVIWEKPNAMPESVDDRPTKSHEHIFMFTKTRSEYWWDKSAGLVPHKRDNRKITTVKAGSGSIQHRDGERWPGEGRNIRTVWSIPTSNYSGAHFAVFPEELPEKCISLSCPMNGVVLDPFCGAGTTLLAARGMGRYGIGIEIARESCERSVRRLGGERGTLPDDAASAPDGTINIFSVLD